MEPNTLCTHPNFPRVALRYLRPLKVINETEELICEDPDCDHPDSDCWLLDEVIEDSDIATVVMKGDDTKHYVPEDELTPITDDVCSCGQLGCSWHLAE